MVKADEEQAMSKADEALKIKLECDADLSVVLPAINAAMLALNTLTSAVRPPQSIHYIPSQYNTFHYNTL